MLASVAKQYDQKKDNASDDFLRAIVDACASNVAVLDESGIVLYASKAWRLLEHDNDPVPEFPDMSAPYFERCRRFTGTEDDVDTNITLAKDIEQILTGEEKEFHRKYSYHAPKGQSPFLMHAARLNLPGSTFRVLMTYEELSSIEEDERLSELLDTTKILAWEGEAEGLRFTHVSDHASKILGYPVTAWYEPDFFASHIHVDDRSQVLASYLRQANVAEQFDLTFRMLASDGNVVWVQNLVSITPGKGSAGRMHGFMIDISDRKHAEEALKDLGSRLITAQEEERKRIARELHDDLNQRMAVLSIELEQLSQEIHEPLRIRKRFRRLQQQAQEISTDIHRLSYKLHPSKLEHLGLALSIKSLCEERSQDGKTRIEFHQRGFPAFVPKDEALCVFRIAQEVLRNCVKHSDAKLAQVLLTKTGNAITLSVSDNGCGFDTNSDVMEKGLGFVSMKERLRIVEGEISIRSHPRFGTHVVVSVPLDDGLFALPDYSEGSDTLCAFRHGSHGQAHVAH